MRRFKSGLCVLGCLLLSLALRAESSHRIPGISRPVYEAELGAQLPGTIEDVLVQRGDRVAKGDVLLRFVGRSEELAVRSAKLMLDDKSELDAATHRVELVTKALKALTELNSNTGSVSQDELDAKTLEQQLELANKARLAVREEQEALQLDLAREQLELRKLKAPRAGIVTAVAAEDGEYAALDEPLLRLVDIRTCYFECSLGIKQAVLLKLNQMHEVELKTPLGVIIRPAEISYIAPVVDRASGLIEVRLTIANEDQEIRPGVSGNLLLPEKD